MHHGVKSWLVILCPLARLVLAFFPTTAAILVGLGGIKSTGEAIRFGLEFKSDFLIHVPAKISLDVQTKGALIPPKSGKSPI
jgi:hypothetical protein